jgi:hypothetical protein
MKKVFLGTTMVVMILMSFSSCKKDWSCACTDQSGNTTSTAINNETLLDARAKCKDMGYNIGAASETCSLQ